ncbi:MAG: hypothetical protein U0746_12710 [Gemmataceae bacterium]
MNERRYSLDESAQRGREIYERVIKPKLRAEDADKFVAVDIETEQYEIDASDSAAGQKMLDRRPDAQVFMLRVGHPAAYRIGFFG